MTARLSGLILLALGLSSAAFALAGDYTVLMNPAFRWVTIGGALLVTGLGVVLSLSSHGGSRSALVIFGLFLALVAVARPETGGVAPLLVPPAGQPTLEREGYERLESRALFRNLDEEVRDLPGGQVVMRGFVKRLDSLDARGQFILLEPLMACCLADAVALGLRVRNGAGVLPEDGSWIHVFGDLDELDAPVATRPFRVGAILFVQVSRVHELVAHEIVTYESLLEDLYAKTPAARCSVFRRLADESGLAESLRGEGPLTVFVPLDASFERLPPADRKALTGDPGRAGRLLEGLIVPGRLNRQDLYERTSLTTLDGRSLPVRIENGKLLIGGARVLFGDQGARNGILHIVHPIPRASDAGR